MKKITLGAAVLAALSACSVSSGTAENAQLISEQDAIQAALAEVGVEVLGIRFDAPDTQWDVFVKLGDKAYEIEVDAASSEIVTAEEESLAEVEAELSGDLSHEGVEGDVDK